MIALRNTLFLAMSIALTGSCSVDPSNIDFGSDQCHYCKMSIVDRMHAAQYVTEKGKQFKFDAIECMIAQLEEIDEEGLAHILVSDYGQEGRMIPASQARYLISKKIKSPMGACLSAFSSSQIAEDTKKEFTGELYDWPSIKTELAQ